MYESVTAVTDRGANAWSAGQESALATGLTNRTHHETEGRWSQRTQSLLGVQIVGTGSYVPDQIVTNADLQQRYGFDPAWIEQRTGILARRYAAPEQATSDLCVEAARRAIRSARVSARDIDLVVVGTFSPDYHCPTTANLVQEALRIDAPAMDVQAACSGFVYALATAAQFVATGNSKLALVIGGDCNSRIVNPRDQKVAPLFGDGAGAVLLARGNQHQGLICYQLGSDGGGGKLLDRPSGGTKKPITAADLESGSHYLHMDGKSVFKWAVRALTESIDLVLRQSGLSVDDVGLYVLHQANIRIINNAVDQLGIPTSRVYNNLQHYGNTSGGSVPLALDEAIQQGRLSRGDTLLMSGFGAGLTWGTCLFRW
jgi:3-oxoacyl-[acyl-carrier-protein] synthase-3